MKQYYIYDGQIKKGPFNLEQLKSQSLSRETPVWYEGLENWAMAGNLEELKELFIRKNVPPPLPKSFEKNSLSRNEVLNSFADADELLPEPRKRSLLIPVLIFLIIAGIVIWFVYYK